jgi:heme-degrading monooxygenase HmoA
MFAVIFEVRPSTTQWDAYLSLAGLLKPQLLQIPGFIDNIRYRSLTRPGWILSLSSWKDEKALVRWRTKASHHEVQEEGRGGVLTDYHLRVGQYVNDSHVPEGFEIVEQRLESTEVGVKWVVLVDAVGFWGERVEEMKAEEVAGQLGLKIGEEREGLGAWDAFDAVLTPGDVILLTEWRDDEAARKFEDHVAQTDGMRVRKIRVVRDYGMFDRREAPQYYPDADGRETLHA